MHKFVGVLDKYAIQDTTNKASYLVLRERIR